MSRNKTLFLICRCIPFVSVLLPPLIGGRSNFPPLPNSNSSRRTVFLTIHRAFRTGSVQRQLTIFQLRLLLPLPVFKSEKKDFADGCARFLSEFFRRTLTLCSANMCYGHTGDTPGFSGRCLGLSRPGGQNVWAGFEAALKKVARPGHGDITDSSSAGCNAMALYGPSAGERVTGDPEDQVVTDNWKMGEMQPDVNKVKKIKRFPSVSVTNQCQKKTLSCTLQINTLARQCPRKGSGKGKKGATKGTSSEGSGSPASSSGSPAGSSGTSGAAGAGAPGGGPPPPGKGPKKTPADAVRNRTETARKQ